MTTRGLTAKLPASVAWKIEAMRKDYKNAALSKDETRAEIAGYVMGLRDAGLINERERQMLFVYATV